MSTIIAVLNLGLPIVLKFLKILKFFMFLNVLKKCICLENPEIV